MRIDIHILRKAKARASIGRASSRDGQVQVGKMVMITLGAKARKVKARSRLGVMTKVLLGTAIVRVGIVEIKTAAVGEAMTEAKTMRRSGNLTVEGIGDGRFFIG